MQGIYGLFPLFTIKRKAFTEKYSALYVAFNSGDQVIYVCDNTDGVWYFNRRLVSYGWKKNELGCSEEGF